MGLYHRKLITELCQSICHVDKSCSSDCNACIKVCLTIPQYPYYPPPSPPSPVPPFYLDSDEHQGKHHQISTFLIVTLAVLAAAFFLVCCAAVCVRFWNRSRRRVSSRQQTEETRDDFLDEEHGPVVDHPIWYIRTPGLQQSIINAITVCKYKKGDGLIEGTECSVCLSEFEEDENLRLLPKCHHAFHLPCIDTWLRSHTNCPMCRAPIVTHPAARIPSLEPHVVDSSSLGNNTHMEILENSGETSDEMESSAPELRNTAREEGDLEVEDGTRVCETESTAAEMVSIQPRRSVSLDSSSAAKINLALATVLSVESPGNSNRLLREVNEQIVSKRVTGNGNLPATAKGSSSFRTRYLPRVPSSMNRSHS